MAEKTEGMLSPYRVLDLADERGLMCGKLMGDLGAESIDFLDIVFRLEKAFSIKIPREELFPAESLMSNPDFVSNGKLTEKGLNEIREKLPHTNLSEFEKNPDLNKLGDLFTVTAIINFIDGRINAA